MQSVTVEEAPPPPRATRTSRCGERITIDAMGERLEIVRVRATVAVPVRRKKPIRKAFAEIRGLAEDLTIERDPSPERPVEL